MRAASQLSRQVQKPAAVQGQLSLLDRTLPDATLARIRSEFPGWDVYALQAEFDDWLRGDPNRAPKNYGAAFHGFVRKHHAKHG